MRALIAIPTYNERDNLQPLVAEVLRAVAADVLIVDTSSPDGTGAQADALEQRNEAVSAVHLPSGAGLAEAYVAIYEHMLAGSYDRLIQLDADRSHQPAQLPAMLEALEEAELVVGSRYVKGAELHSALAGRLLSRLSNAYASILLQLPVRDLTSSFLGFRRNVLEALHFENLTGRRYGLPVELKYRAAQLGFRVVEIPIEYRDRAEGDSKLRPRHVLATAARVFALRWKG